MRLIDTFAKCLASKDVVVYGAYWCPHCQNQKKLFGERVPICAVCRSILRKRQNAPQRALMDIRLGYSRNGSRIAGEMSFQELSDKTVCPFASELTALKNHYDK